ncbi:dynein light intermediate chain 1, cytosolic [Cryptococcus deuterogattii 99/473]|uniref:Dynein light intermediate chain 1, cytosolic n=1 Tax=Cryptococcus deuterogattii Ram5 TaxID=1296110 RepID=A0A0D0V4G1_9TREE|nr:dynein light intermediate chain 1, cytosolic [Cryptococcus deuterogattii Ram5]KIY59696.1 dynein light intermediate chain 1, cytosolic [Cryptococcus deuterogattii 99/473]
MSAAGPSRTPPPGPSAPDLSFTHGSTSDSAGGIRSTNGTSLWNEVLASTDRQKTLGRKNVILLSERNHGRTHLLSQLTPSKREKSSKSNSVLYSNGQSKSTFQPGGKRGGLALGYEVIDAGEEDSDSSPPISVFYPPSSHPSLLKLVPTALPPKSLADTAVMIVLDWTKPSSMLQELLNWLSWVEAWALGSAKRGETEELHERLQSYFQHYTEPSATNMGVTAYSGLGPLLPLGAGTLTLNSSGIPIIVVCTKADLMDNVAEETGIKGGRWEERTDWAQQVLRTICLSYGAALFYTAPTRPATYTLLKSYLLHRLYTVPPPLSLHPMSLTDLSHTVPSPAQGVSTRYPFAHRANVLDRDAVMVPSGWDSWGKINVLREGFDPERVEKAWTVSLRHHEQRGMGDGGADGQKDDGEEGLEVMWMEMIPDTSRGPRLSGPSTLSILPEPEQTFLARHLEVLLKDPNRDPRQSFRLASTKDGIFTPGAGNNSSAVIATAGLATPSVVGPMIGDSLSLPGVEKVMKKMEGGKEKEGEELKEKFAKLGRREDKGSGSISGSAVSADGATAGERVRSTSGGTPAMPNEALHNFFQGLLANRGKTATPVKTQSPGENK